MKMDANNQNLFIHIVHAVIYILQQFKNVEQCAH